MFGGKVLPPSMFKTLRAGTAQGDPTADEMANKFEEALHSKHVNLKEVSVKIFDLSDAQDAAEYCTLYRDLYAQVQRKEAIVRCVERKFVEVPSPRWLVFLEWWTYALEVDGKEVTPEEYDKILHESSIVTEDPEPPIAEQLAAAGHIPEPQGEDDEGEDS